MWAFVECTRVRLHVQMALLAAMKFHCAVRALGLPAARHPAILALVVRQGIAYFSRLCHETASNAGKRWLHIRV